MNLTDIPIYDHHAHALLHEPLWRAGPIEPYFTEATDPLILQHFARDTLFFRRSMRDLAAYYGCAPTMDAVLEARQNQDYGDLARHMFQDARIDTVLIDDGVWPDRLWSVRQSADRLPCAVRRVLRLESEVALLAAEHDSAAGLLTALETHLRHLAPTLAGLKSIAAYRTGLDISRPTAHSVEAAFTVLKRETSPGAVPRVNSKPLIDSVVWTGLRVAVDTGLPVQFHTGYGDPDLDMRLASPLHLRGVLEAPELRGLKVVMLHCYPYVREAGYLASVYGGAYLDLGLTIPYTSVTAMRTATLEALHLAPVTKVLFSTDAQRTPELYWLAARWGRTVLGDALDLTVRDGDLSPQEADWAARRILHDNARDLYPSIVVRAS
ncbi:amidohydrolase family protein [Deinococcus deserti]|uniref:Putative amidohydrolase 2 n=1 Tax=Deinococcus deserti (strain DSM 17065 / CIP 109153 / LMG 22923 / VCD115) TaxID=546414 RepID=C1D3D0_DEIDV|nr:amidohydrolase family protein [Deinococcus deserti]ACO48009.1 putative amidohydrolase 2 [Deinococcus deserti VCD115]